VSTRRTHYQVLQVDVEADQEIISVVHRRLAQRHHPDRDSSPGARERMLAINLAYEVLKDPVKRAAYDAELAARRDRRTNDRVVRRAAPEAGYGEAGAPTGPASGSILDFGRYKGWSLGQIARHDPEFLEWLERMPAGRVYRDEIDRLLRRR
jgi:DnaJ-class molecular chaperone